MDMYLGHLMEPMCLWFVGTDPRTQKAPSCDQGPENHMWSLTSHLGAVGVWGRNSQTIGSGNRRYICFLFLIICEQHTSVKPLSPDYAMNYQYLQAALLETVTVTEHVPTARQQKCVVTNWKQEQTQKTGTTCEDSVRKHFF